MIVLLALTVAFDTDDPEILIGKKMLRESCDYWNMVQILPGWQIRAALGSLSPSTTKIWHDVQSYP